jgi:hypothetical protein
MAPFQYYIKMTEEEDNKMARLWNKDADGILIFVSLYINHIHIVDRFILCRTRRIGHRLDSRPKAKFTRYLGILPRKHLIYQLLADPNVSRASILSSPPPFSPSKSAMSGSSV